MLLFLHFFRYFIWLLALNTVINSTMSKSLDRIDRSILRLLQSDGRLSNVELARRINLSPTPCLERVRRLEKAGFIRGYSARLNPSKLHLGLAVFVQVTLDKTTSDVFEKFKAAVGEIDEVVECHMVAGGFDYILKVRTADMDAFRAFLGDIINNLPGIASTSTYVVMEAVKEGESLPVPSS